MQWEWWVVNIVSMAVMVLLGEYLMIKQEQRPIEMDSLFRPGAKPPSPDGLAAGGNAV